MDDRIAYIEKLKSRTKRFAVEVIKFCNNLKTSKASSVITYQLIKSVTSTAANYRAACLARSNKEFYSKICIVVEEADETVFWLEVIRDAELEMDSNQLNKLLAEGLEISKIMSTAKRSVSTKL